VPKERPTRTAHTAPDQITKQDLEALVRFLPAFEQAGRVFVERWEGGRPDGDGLVHFPHPIYCEDVARFFKLVGQLVRGSGLSRSPRTTELTQNPGLIASATRAEAFGVLANCGRLERFVDGHWEQMLNAGVVQAALRRLKTLLRDRQSASAP
jgi:hypothetical protein